MFPVSNVANLLLDFSFREKELVDDFMALLASFTGRYSQLKSRDAKKALLSRALSEVGK